MSQRAHHRRAARASRRPTAPDHADHGWVHYAVNGFGVARSFDPTTSSPPTTWPTNGSVIVTYFLARPDVILSVAGGAYARATDKWLDPDANHDAYVVVACCPHVRADTLEQIAAGSDLIPDEQLANMRASLADPEYSTSWLGWIVAPSQTPPTPATPPAPWPTA